MQSTILIYFNMISVTVLKFDHQNNQVLKKNTMDLFLVYYFCLNFCEIISSRILKHPFITKVLLWLEMATGHIWFDSIYLWNLTQLTMVLNLLY